MRSYLGYVLALVVFVLFMGAGGFYLEEHGHNANVHGFGDGLWWAIVTMTTVGYGDISPVTPGGRMVGAVLMISGISALGLFTATIAAYMIRARQLDALWIRRMHDHVVICGAGAAGSHLAHAFRDAGEPVVVVDKNELNPRLDTCRDRGAAILVGDATRVETLRQAGVDRAKHLVIVCGADGTNVEAAARARTLARQTRTALSCASEIADPDLWYALRGVEIGAKGGFRLEFFNAADLAARGLLAAHSPFLSSAAPHVLIAGAGALSQQLVRHLLREWRDRPDRGGALLEITLIDRDTTSVDQHLRQRHPELGVSATLRSLSLDLRSPMFQRGQFLYDEAGSCAITHAYVCVEDEGLALSTALLLLHQLRRHHVPVVVRAARQAGVAALLGADGGRGESGAVHALQVFSLIEQAYQPELVLNGTNEVIARALHQEYLARMAAAGTANAATVPWDALARDLKESNRTQADRISDKLETIGCHIVPLTTFDMAAFALSDDEVEQLARMEHEQWVAERRALGWTPGPRDPEKKTNPNLIPWQDLDNNVRNYNRDSVRQLPQFLNRAGFTAHRYTK
jgi:voltage-gated potassium channel Kch